MSRFDKPALSPEWIRQVRRNLLEWFAIHRRPMPWRDDPNPYYVWLSEVMLQQTQVATVIPYFERFVARFPTIEALANASLEEVLRYWEGLGYYARAHHLHETAKRIAQAGGQFPPHVEKLRELPGIGAYTAGAIASIAFQQPEPAVDGNITRVLARLLWLEDNLKQGTGNRLLWQIARELVDPERPGDFNQALMELGATVCTPAQPACEECPLQKLCSAYRFGQPTALPKSAPAKPVQRVVEVSVIVRRGDSVLLAKRPDVGLWGGLWEFPRATQHKRESIEAVAQRALETVGVHAKLNTLLGKVRHAVTYSRIDLYGYLCEYIAIVSPSQSYVQREWVVLDQLEAYPLSAPQRKLAKLLQERVRNPELFTPTAVASSPSAPDENAPSSLF